jgi:hypothetical protein
MLRVTIKSIMLSVVVLNVFMLSVCRGAMNTDAQQGSMT